MPSTRSAPTGRNRATGQTIPLLLAALVGAEATIAKTGSPPVAFAPLEPVFQTRKEGLPQEAALLDLNADGYPDLVVAKITLPREDRALPIQLLVNDRKGGFVDGTARLMTGAPPAVVHPREIVIADFNGDSRDDVFIADHGYDRDPFAGGQSRMILSARNGKYFDASARLPQQLRYTHSASAADVDLDGDVDLFMGNLWSTVLTPPELLLNDGKGNFSSAPAGWIPPEVSDFGTSSYTSNHFVDVDLDGDPDLVLGGDDISPTTLLLNEGGSGFSAPVANAFPPKALGDGSATLDVQSHDIDEDGFEDLLVLTTGPGTEGRHIQFLVNARDGTFSDATSRYFPDQRTAGLWAKYLHLFDANGDGRTDIYIEFDGRAKGRLLVSDARGRYSHRRMVELPGHDVDEPIDIDLDGCTDYVTGDSKGGFFVGRSTCPIPGTVVPMIYELLLRN